jgi:hypothetical protein
MSVIDEWVSGLPAAVRLHVVSLLGRKPNNGPSEFEPYPFRSEPETNDKPTLREWLTQHYEGRLIAHEFPTVDTEPIPDDFLRAIRARIQTLLNEGCTVVVVDSAGFSRTGRVCREMSFREPRLDGAPLAL